MDNHVVIMAGGIGSRFWPMSTPECPKQFIDVMGCGRSLIQLTADRFDGVCPKENMWVVTSEKYIDIVREQLPDMPESNILAEPCARNTAPCLCLLENQKETSECQYRSDSFGCIGYRYGRISQGSGEGSSLYE